MAYSSVFHFTTVHPRTDTRIRIKEVATLARTCDADVRLYVQDGLGDERGDGFRIVDTGPRPQGRLRRMTLGAFRMYRAIHRTRPDVAHFHDPELLPWAFLLQISGIKVVYDVHEDVAATVLSKDYLPGYLRRPLAWSIRFVERLARRLFSAIVAATPAIGRNFGDKPVLVQNFPLLNELTFISSVPYRERPPYFAYIGGITGIRSASEMVEAIGHLTDSDVRLHMGGSFSPKSLEKKVTALNGWSRVKFHGWVDRRKVRQILSSVRAGLVLFHPVPNHIRAQPNKLFEYMAAGLPVIASDFPLWREIVEGAECGLLVDPQDPQAIAEAMQWILDNPDEAAEMGRRGRAAVEERYNWEAESEKLVALYRHLLTES